jgi:hypothetical protein
MEPSRRLSVNNFMRALCEHHPHSRGYVRQFLRAWRVKLQWAEANDPFKVLGT